MIYSNVAPYILVILILLTPLLSSVESFKEISFVCNFLKFLNFYLSGQPQLKPLSNSIHLIIINIIMFMLLGVTKNSQIYFLFVLFLSLFYLKGFIFI